jgi:hypothetical protein
MTLILALKAKAAALMTQCVVLLVARKETRLNSFQCKSGRLCGNLNPILTPANQ